MARLGLLYQGLKISDASSSDAVSRDTARNRRAKFTGSTALLARAVQVGSSLITIPLTIHYLGNEQFGLWVTISSLLAMATFADFGIGNGVLNIVAYADGQNDRDRIRRAISSGFAVLGAVALVVLVLFATTANWLSWPDILHVTSPRARSETAPAILVFSVCFALNIPLDLVQRAQLGLQEGFRTNLWQLVGSVSGLAGVILGIHLRVPLPTLVAVLAGAPVLATALNTLHFFGMSRPDLRPRLRYVSRGDIHRILSYGTLFFVLQLVAAVSFSADSFIIARVLGVAQVPAYSIPQRMFSLISMMTALLVTPLWPAYAEAISRGDIPWVRHTLKRSLTIVFLMSCVASFALLLLARTILAWWIGPQFQTSFVLLLGLALWSIVECCGATSAMFMNGANIVRFQIVVATIFGVTCLAVKVYVTKRFGIEAVPWATLLTYIPLVAVPLIFYVPRALRHLHAGEFQVKIATPAE